MTFEEVAERLRKLGVTCGVMAYESGYETIIKDPSYHSEFLPFCDTLDEAAQYLHAAAKRLYPDTYGKEEA